MRNRNRSIVALLGIALAAGGIVPRSARSADEKPKPEERKTDAKEQPKPNEKASPLDTIRALAGTWVAVETEADKPPATIVFKSTSADSAVMETMFPGSDHEMINLYTLDGDVLTLTHYCSMGNQPRMRLAPSDDGALHFDYADAGNLKSRAEPHMDSVQITIQGDRLTEKWAMYRDGKITGYHSFELKRKG